MPALLDEVHALIEEYPDSLRFLLTGSSARKLKRGGANLLAGRAWELRLFPFTHLEVKLDFERALQFGTLPKIYLSSGSPLRSLNSYVNTYLKEEIQQEALVRKIDSFVRFLEVAAQLHGEPVNFSSVAKAANVSDKTAEEYFSILVDTLIAFRIDGWSQSVKKQLLQSPRFYFFDCGVLNALRGELHTPLSPSSNRYGKLFETWVILEFVRLNSYFERDFKFNYWRTNAGQEVDLVLSRGKFERLIAVEIKSSSMPGESDFTALRSFGEDNPDSILYCLCQTPHSYKIDNIEVMGWQEGMERILLLPSKGS